MATTQSNRTPIGTRKRGKEGASGQPVDAVPRSEPKWIAPALGTSVIIFVLIAWQVCATTGIVNPVFSSTPVAVATAILEYLTSNLFYEDLAYTGATFGIGLIISLAAGTAIGALLGWYKYLRYSLDYLISIAYASPRIALIPLIILWFGIDMEAGVIIVILVAIWPPIMNTMTAIRTIDPGYLDLGRSLKMSRSQLFRNVLIPAAVPSILTAARLSIGLALIGVVVGEFLAGTRGLGYRINEAASNYQPDKVFAGVVMISAAGVLLTEVVKMIERHFDRWRT
jgi:ABC-type nitrate/sulfonate/bicarbonate transport system permease component